ncbi:hypothetical protein, partial [Streptomyces sp. GC420]|uniref:aspartate racemase/maleate isomerase family protein n=1 Tax=Streptomyces sp. GC420 TaxID=2697568 RepID=UPI001414F1A0
MTAVGLLCPGHPAEDDYPRIETLLGSDIRIPIVHTDGGAASGIAALPEKGAGPRLAAVTEELRLSGSEAVVWTSMRGSFLRGWEGAREQMRELALAAGIPASSTALGFPHAVRALGLGRVSVATAYPADVAERFTSFLRGAGIAVVAVSAMSAGTADRAAEAGTWGHEEVLRLARDGDHPDAETVLLPDTALHTASCLPELSGVQAEVAGHGAGVRGHRDAHAGRWQMTLVKIVGHRATSRLV